MSLRFVWLLTLVLLIPPAAVSAQPNTGTVTGKVTYRGKPLADGLVTFLAKGAKVVAKIHPDGAYKASGVPVGKVLIVVESKGIKAPPADTPAKSMPLPYTVGAALQSHNIELK
jgi:hypothetical protein